MNDRELLEYIAAQVGILTKDVAEVKQDMQEGFKKVETRLTKIESTIENNLRPDIKVCLTELSTVKEKQTEHDLRFDRLEEKIEHHDIKIQVIEGGKRA